MQVGQLLLYARVSNNNRMLPFCSQIMEMVMGRGKATGGASGESAAVISHKTPVDVV